MAKRATNNKTSDATSSAKCYQLSHREKERLFNQYIVPNFSSIRSLTRRYTINRQDVEENYNYCLAQLYHYIGSYNPEQKLDTWIHICVKRACLLLNKKKVEEASHYTDIEMCAPDVLHQNGINMVTDIDFGNLTDNISDTLYMALMKIPAQRLSPFMLYAQGYGIREITAFEWKMGHLEKRSEDLVKSRIYWAKRYLQLILRKDGITGENYQG